MGEHLPNLIRLDCAARRVIFIHSNGQCVEIDFAGPQARRDIKPFLLCCGIAMAQDLSCNNGESTVWTGADEAFLASMIEHLDWRRDDGKRVQTRTCYEYWAQYRKGPSGSPARVDIYLDGNKLTKKDGRLNIAGELFQRQDGLFLGPRVQRTSDTFLYCPIEFSHQDETYNELKQHVAAFLRAVPQAHLSQGGYLAHSKDHVFDGVTSHICTFDAFIEDRSRGFVGRDFVFDRLDNFLSSPDRKSGYFLIQGEPGIGKSAILSQVVRRYQCDVHHFNIAAQGINTPRRFLANTGARLIRQFGLPYRELPPDFDQDGAFLATLMHQASSKLAGQQRLIIAIDALDEVDAARDVSRTNVLFLPPSLPPGVFIVTTARNVPEVRFDVADCELLPLDPGSVENIHDASVYIKSHLQSKGVHAWLRQQGLRENAFVKTLLHKSSGNFMYLRHVLLAIERGEYRSVDMAALPDGLRAYYRSHWDKMRRLGPEEFASFAEPIVCVLAAAGCAVSIEQIELTTGLPRARIRDVLRKWREFLTEEQIEGVPSYRVYHSTFREFLEQEVDPDLRTYHEMIVNSALKRAGGLRSPNLKSPPTSRPQGSRRTAPCRGTRRKGSR